MKKQRTTTTMAENPFNLLSEELIFHILDKLPSSDTKSFSLLSKSFHTLESDHRHTLHPTRPDHLPSLLTRYPNLTRIDFTLCASRLFPGKWVTAMVAGCRNLVELDFSNATEMTDSAAAAISEAKKLEKLWIGRCKKITDIGIGCIAVGCTKLKVVNLKWCLGIGDLGIQLLAVKCKQLTSLDLSYLPITSVCLPAILKLKHLEELILEGCYGKGSQSLKSLDLSSCKNVTHVGLSSFTSGTNCLQKLTLAYGSAVTLDLARSFQKLSKLQLVKLDGCQVTCAGLQAIGNCCFSIHELSLSKCSGVTDEGLTFIVKRHKELRKLDITCCKNISYVSIAHLANSCRFLTCLRMESCTLVPKEAFILIGQRCHLLDELDFTDNEIDDEGLKSISKCSKLAILKLGICLNITNEGLTYIGNHCSKLTELDLYRSMEISDSGIVAIASGSSSLEMINVSYCIDITDRSLMSLAKCAKLSTVECRGCPLVTSLGIAAIAVGCKRLTKLDIKKCYNINDFGILPLSHFSQNLRQINMSYTSVTDVGILSLANIRCLQSMTLLHVKGLSPRGLAAALLACSGLNKVKLHLSFKSLLPQRLFDHLEARGCVFLWREKVFQVEVEDSKHWKLQLDEINNATRES